METTAERNLEQILATAKQVAHTNFTQRKKPVTNDGRLMVGDQEYVMVSKKVLDNLGDVLGGVSADIVLYRMGYSMGEYEAKNLMQQGQLPNEPLTRCLVRPFYYMASGLGTVDVLELNYDSNHEKFHVLYEDTRPVASRLVMGYSAGWKSTMLGVQLEAKAIPHSGPNLRVLVALKRRLVTMVDEPQFAKPRSAYNVTSLRL